MDYKRFNLLILICFTAETYYHTSHNKLEAKIPYRSEKIYTFQTCFSLMNTNTINKL